MRIAVVSTQVPFMRGGAEVHADNLVSAFRNAGHDAELVTIPFKWYPARVFFNHITIARLVDLSECAGRPVDRVIGLKFPAYIVPHPNKVLWILHQHRTAYDLWDHPEHGDLIHDYEGKMVREAIFNADRQYIPEARAIFSNSKNVARRLQKYCGIASQPLYHPPGNAELFYSNSAEPYLFFPSRINPLKRQSLVVEALRHCRQEVNVTFAGIPENPAVMDELRKRVRSWGLEKRVQWRGYISDEEKLRLYANCLGVIYPPLDEDYGYITLEAMLAQKPVVTTRDAGGPLEFIKDGVSGLIVEPTPRALAAAMDKLWEDFGRAGRWGKAGREIYESLNITWQGAVEALLK